MEIWKSVKDPLFKKFYEISNLGRLRTKGRFVTRGGPNNTYTYWKSPRIVSTRRSKENPHLFSSLYYDSSNRNKTAYIHRMVAEAFLKRPSSKHVYVTHLDGNYDNNLVSNLKWITASENSTNIMLKYPENRSKLKEHNLKVGYYSSLKLPIWDKENASRIHLMHKLKFSIKEISEVFNCSQSSIYSVIKNK